MATITLNGVAVEADDGRPLVEVIKEQGIAITNLCYIDGLEPYAGCRTCLVEIEGARPTPMQLSCTAVVADGMSVDTETPLVKQARQQVLSIINANHPDRCLTCHRRVKCMPGDICLRDDVITHRCLTCSKNYRCELQTANELLDMGEFGEPWVGDARSYYETPPPEPDRANPYLEFDPQMCILCTRCVRACTDLRHTDAISLAGKGFETRIAFGTGGPVHESDCDFCGACIDVCPTATLMEKPNKWAGRADDWTNSVCNSCAVGCTISYGTAANGTASNGAASNGTASNGAADSRPVIVRPDRLNPVSRDQICVRGRFGYAAIEDRQRLTRSLVRRGENLLPAPPEEALESAVQALARVRREHGADAIAVLGSPLATNEEAYLLAKLARDVIGTAHVDFSTGPVHRAVAGALRDAFGVERLPATLTDIERAQTIVVVAGDIEQSHQVVSLRVKDAVVNGGAKLVLVSPRHGELVPFADAWLQPAPGHEAATVQSLAGALSDTSPPGAGRDEPLPPAGVDEQALADAIAALRAGREGEAADAAQDAADAGATFAVIFAPDPVGAEQAAECARACANLAIAARGDAAPAHLHYLPTDANVLGVSDMGLTPAEGGKSFPEIVEAANAGEIRALLIHDDNPLLSAPGSEQITAALESVEALIVIDSLRSTAAEHADVVLAELPFFAREGTITSADRRILRQRPAAGARGEERSGIAILSALAAGLGGLFSQADAGEVMAEIAERVPSYLPYPRIASGRTRALPPEDEAARCRSQPVAAAREPATGALTLITGRSLYTSWEGASIRSEDADQLRREQSVLINPRDAEAAGVRTDDDVVLTYGARELQITASIDDGVAPGVVYVPQYFDGGAVMRFFPLEGTASATATVRLHALQPA